MVIYSCEKCGKEFKQKGHYTNHLNKKLPCVNENKLKQIITKVVETKSETTTTHSSSHLQMFVLEEFFKHFPKRH